MNFISIREQNKKKFFSKSIFIIFILFILFVITGQNFIYASLIEQDSEVKKYDFYDEKNFLEYNSQKDDKKIEKIIDYNSDGETQNHYFEFDSHTEKLIKVSTYQNNVIKRYSVLEYDHQIGHQINKITDYNLDGEIQNHYFEHDPYTGKLIKVSTYQNKEIQSYSFFEYDHQTGEQINKITDYNSDGETQNHYFEHDPYTGKLIKVSTYQNKEIQSYSVLEYDHQIGHQINKITNYNSDGGETQSHYFEHDPYTGKLIKVSTYQNKEIQSYPVSEYDHQIGHQINKITDDNSENNNSSK